MAEPIEIAYVEIRPDTRGFGAETKRQIQRELATATPTASVRGAGGGGGVAAAGASAGIKRVGADATATTGTLKGLTRQSSLTTASLGAMGGAAARTGVLLGAGGVAAGIAATGLAAKGLIGAAVDFESSFAGVVKTVDATDQELKALSETFLEMSTRIPINVNELNAIGEAAGALGIEKGAIAGFTDTVAKLGVTTDLTSDVAADALARMANITQLPQDQFDNLGSTLVQLGNRTAATESEITDFALRISGAGHQVGLTQSEILGFGAALASLGLNAEAGGTAISTTFVKIASTVAKGGEKLDQFAAVSGKSAQEFAEEFRTKPAQAVTEFIKGLGRVDAEGGNVFATLDQLGLGGIRVRDALLRAAGSGELLESALKTGNQAWRENNALQKEATIRFGTTASQIQLFKNNVNALQIEIGQALLPAVNSAFDGLTSMVQAIRDSEGAAAAARDVYAFFKTIVEEIGQAFRDVSPLLKQAFGDIGVIVQRSIVVLKPLAKIIGFTLKVAIYDVAAALAVFAKAWRSLSDVIVAVVGRAIDAIDKFLGGLSTLADAASHIPFIGDKFGGVADAINGAREDLRDFKGDLEAIDGTSVDTTVRVNVITVRPTGRPGAPGGIDLQPVTSALPPAGPAGPRGVTSTGGGVKLPRAKPSGITAAEAEARATRLRENVEIARLRNETLADDKVALRELAAWARQMSANARLKPAIRRQFLIEALQAEAELRSIAAQEEDAARAAADAEEQAADERTRAAKERADARAQEREGILQGNLRLAQLTENTIRDDRVALRALIRFWRERIKAVGIATAAGRQYLAQIRAARNELREITEREKENRLQATEDRLRDNLTLAGLTENTIKDDERALNALIRYYRKRVNESKKGSAERRKWLIELRRTQKELRELREEEKDVADEAGRSFAEQTFSLLQTQQGFAGRLLSNLLPTGSTAGLLTPGPTPGTSAAGGGSIDREDVPGLPRTPGQTLTTAQAASDNREGITRGQAQALLDTQRRMLAVLREIQRGTTHPEAANQAITSKANMEIV